MIEKAVIKLVQQMENGGLINHDMSANYIYALQILFERWLTVITIMAISIICHQVIASGIFLIFFLSLRARTGGYHAKKFWHCYIGTVFTYVLVLWISPIIGRYPNMLGALTLFSAIIIVCIAPLNHPNMNLNREEILALRKSSRYLLFLECAIILISFITGQFYFAWMSISIILCAILLGIAKITKQEV